MPTIKHGSASRHPLTEWAHWICRAHQSPSASPSAQIHDVLHYPHPAWSHSTLMSDGRAFRPVVPRHTAFTTLLTLLLLTCLSFLLASRPASSCSPHTRRTRGSSRRPPRRSCSRSRCSPPTCPVRIGSNH
jgi:hypothetical protein